MPADMAVFGEVGLSGEVRAVSQADTRLKEAAKLGFAQALIPSNPRKGKGFEGGSLIVRPVGHLQDLLGLFRQT